MRRRVSEKKIIIILLILASGFKLQASGCFAKDITLNDVKIAYKKDDYQEAIKLGEAFLTIEPDIKPNEEVYYYLGLSYLRIGKFQKAEDIFNLIISEYPDSGFLDRAILGLGDTYYLREYYEKALLIYSMFPSKVEKSIRYPLYYLKILKCNLKLGKKDTVEDNLKIIKEKYPFSEAAKEAGVLSKMDFYFAIQVGAFTQENNALGLKEKLKNEGFDAYVFNEEIEGVIFYKVRVGRFNNSQEAKGVADVLRKKGYSVKIIP